MYFLLSIGLFFVTFLVASLIAKYGSTYRGPPAYIFAGSWDLILNFWALLAPPNENDYATMEGRVLSSLAKIWNCKEEEVLIGSSCRAVFDNFLSVCKERYPGRKKVLATSLMHTSFPKAVNYNGLELDILDIDLPSYQYLFDAKKYDPSHYLAVVITHAFGRPFEIEALVNFAKNNGILIFEDAVQSQMFPVYRGHPLSDTVVFSGGLDKIPSSFGGSPVLTQNNPSLHAALKKSLSALPQQSRWFRFRKLAESTLLFIMYRYAACPVIISCLMTLVGKSMKIAVMGVRKNASGFVHDRELYMTQPSQAGLVSIYNSLQKNWASAHDVMSGQLKILRNALEPTVRAKVFPWIPPGQSDKLNDSCFYLHIYADDPTKLIDYLYSKNLLVLIQQSWFDPGSDCPNTQLLCQKLMILPLPFVQSKAQLETMAGVLNEFYAQQSKEEH